jgi:hypothetical protein
MAEAVRFFRERGPRSSARVQVAPGVYVSRRAAAKMAGRPIAFQGRERTAARQRARAERARRKEVQRSLRANHLTGDRLYINGHRQRQIRRGQVWRVDTVPLPDAPLPEHVRLELVVGEERLTAVSYSELPRDIDCDLQCYEVGARVFSAGRCECSGWIPTLSEMLVRNGGDRLYSVEAIGEDCENRSDSCFFDVDWDRAIEALKEYGRYVKDTAGE